MKAAAEVGVRTVRLLTEKGEWVEAAVQKSPASTLASLLSKRKITSLTTLLLPPLIDDRTMAKDANPGRWIQENKLNPMHHALVYVPEYGIHEGDTLVSFARIELIKDIFKSAKVKPDKAIPWFFAVPYLADVPPPRVHLDIRQGQTLILALNHEGVEVVAHSEFSTFEQALSQLEDVYSSLSEVRPLVLSYDDPVLEQQVENLNGEDIPVHILPPEVATRALLQAALDNHLIPGNFISDALRKELTPTSPLLAYGPIAVTVLLSAYLAFSAYSRKAQLETRIEQLQQRTVTQVRGPSPEELEYADLTKEIGVLQGFGRSAWNKYIRDIFDALPGIKVNQVTFSNTSGTPTLSLSMLSDNKELLLKTMAKLNQRYKVAFNSITSTNVMGRDMFTTTLLISLGGQN